jgi:hypothetical protein
MSVATGSNENQGVILIDAEEANEKLWEKLVLKTLLQISDVSKIWGFHGSDCWACCLMGCNNKLQLEILLFLCKYFHLCKQTNEGY